MILSVIMVFNPPVVAMVQHSIDSPLRVRHRFAGLGWITGVAATPPPAQTASSAGQGELGDLGTLPETF